MEFVIKVDSYGILYIYCWVLPMVKLVLNLTLIMFGVIIKICYLE